ncbi:hypothetical protein [Streptomyces sp. Tue6028]|uniref:hypothetical protein n=1 Tax=Streptomyces sp. Tue6028 TaxID=2036037 RepID=UPI003D726932
MQRLVLAAVDPYIDRQILAQQFAREEEQRRDLAPFRAALASCGRRRDDALLLRRIGQIAPGRPSRSLGLRNRRLRNPRFPRDAE